MPGHNPVSLEAGLPDDGPGVVVLVDVDDPVVGGDEVVPVDPLPRVGFGDDGLGARGGPLPEHHAALVQGDGLVVLLDIQGPCALAVRLDQVRQASNHVPLTHESVDV